MADVDITKYLLSEGPYAVLFVWLLLYVMRTNKERETQYRDEINDMKDEMRTEREEMREERTIWSETLRKFSEKYDVVIDELREIKHRLK